MYKKRRPRGLWQITRLFGAVRNFLIYKYTWKGTLVIIRFDLRVIEVASVWLRLSSVCQEYRGRSKICIPSLRKLVMSAFGGLGRSDRCTAGRFSASGSINYLRLPRMELTSFDSLLGFFIPELFYISLQKLQNRRYKVWPAAM